MIDRFLDGFTALHEEPGDIYTPILLPGDFSPHERAYRFTALIDAELRMTGLGSAGGGSAIQACDDDDDEDDRGDWYTLYSIIDCDVTELEAGRAMIRLHLAELGCPPGTLVQFDEREDRWDGECWHLAEPRSIDEDADAMIGIASPRLSATINPLGAELTSLTDADGRQLMTDADPAFWAGHAPILFPIVGRLNGDVLRLDGVEYPMKQHGFARREMFEVVARDVAGATLRLTANDQTRACYPFDFVLDIRFSIAGATLDIAVTIANRGEAPMPASFGFHPAFAWPLPYGEARENHRITFAADEPGPIGRLADGLIAGDRPSPLEDRTLRLTDDLFADDALIWDPVRSHGVAYGAGNGRGLRIDFPDMPQLGIWTKPGARFVCIEPWHGHADPVGFTGDFRDKPGVFTVAPGGEWRCSMAIALKP